ncbi:MAG: type transport system ATP-binding protein [Acidimicrobiaceae bacterium]
MNAASATAVPVLEVEGLGEAYRMKSRRGWRRRHDEVWAVRDLTFDVASGEMLGVIGANGSGKSTLLLCLAGVIRPSEGRLRVAGRVASLIDLTAGLHRELTGRENILVSGVLSGLSRREVRARLPEIVAFSGLDPDVLDSPLRTYSQGMGLRLAFAVVAHSDPVLLLIDEVLAVGDEEFQAACLRRVDELRVCGTAVVLVSHELDLVVARCDRVAVLEDGELVYLGDPKTAVARYRAMHAGNPSRSVPAPRGLYGATAGRGRNRRRA